MRKLTIEEIKERAKEIGIWEILDNIYTNSSTLLNCRCIIKGHLHKICWANICQGRTCPYCSGQRLSIDIIKERAKKLGKWEVLSGVYINAKTKLVCKCVRDGHYHEINWVDISQNSGCPYCFSKYRYRPTTKSVSLDVEKSGYKLVSEYIDNMSKLHLICPNGHDWFVSWNNWFTKGRRCSECGKITIEKIKDYTKKMGIWRVLSDHYEGCEVKLDCVCVKGNHRHKVNWNSIKQNVGCPFCSNNGVSKWEKSIKKFLVESGVKYVSNDRTQLLNPETGWFLELDVWMPQLNKAIECNSFYWHNKNEVKQHDKIKQQLCKQQEIDLLVITDKEWNEDIDRCKEKIKTFVMGG